MTSLQGQAPWVLQHGSSSFFQLALEFFLSVPGGPLSLWSFLYKGVLCAEDTRPGYPLTDSKLPEQLKSRWWLQVLLLWQNGLALVHHLGPLRL